MCSAGQRRSFHEMAESNVSLTLYSGGSAAFGMGIHVILFMLGELDMIWLHVGSSSISWVIALVLCSVVYKETGYHVTLLSHVMLAVM